MARFPFHLENLEPRSRDRAQRTVDLGAVDFVA